ncbi:DUF4238 domain-containing protein [Vineibacter terrae]|nr:DUF4238 domain-containing protein [Vineibacter terrae]
MAKQVTKCCHWVAQSYLKAFAADEGRQRIWRFSRNDGESEVKHIDKVAVKFHLYAPLQADGRRDDAVEKKLAELENFSAIRRGRQFAMTSPIFPGNHCARW